MSRAYFVIDAFAGDRFQGNPAAVVLDADGMPDLLMAQTAAEFNLSETTFVLPPEQSPTPGDDCLSVRFRWFTPTREVDLCGHATIAGVHALVESGRLEPRRDGSFPPVRIETRSGVLEAVVEPAPDDSGKRLIWLAFPPCSTTEVVVPIDSVLAALGMTADDVDPDCPPATTQEEDLLLFVRSYGVLNAVRPDFGKLAEVIDRYGLRGVALVTVRTLAPSISAQSRFFAPTYGVNEDPVTGSLHGPLAAYLMARSCVPIQDGVGGMMCTQGIPGGRAGVVYALAECGHGGAYDVRIAGSAVTVMRGTIEVGC